MHAIVGREAELEAVERFLDGVPSGPLALVVEGEAGIGKTTLWLEAVRAAEDRAYRVLQVRPAQSEAELSYVALADLARRGVRLDARVPARAAGAGARDRLAARRAERTGRSADDGDRAGRRPDGAHRRRAARPCDRRRPVARCGLGSGARVRRAPAPASRGAARDTACRRFQRGSARPRAGRCRRIVYSASYPGRSRSPLSTT